MNDLIRKIEQWAEDRNLVKGATPQSQMLKLTEEVGELAYGVARNNTVLITDAIGDCIVVLIILAYQYNIRLEACVEGAYEEIKDRKGKMSDGIFIKDE
jgi:NTP pyrophosphatase (non-canonical NTP hydrolase)